MEGVVHGRSLGEDSLILKAGNVRLRLESARSVEEIMECARLHEVDAEVPALSVPFEGFWVRPADDRFTVWYSSVAANTEAVIEVQVHASEKGGTILELQFQPHPQVLGCFVFICIFVATALIALVATCFTQRSAWPLLYVVPMPIPIAIGWHRLANPNVRAVLEMFRKNIAADLKKV